MEDIVKIYNERGVVGALLALAEQINLLQSPIDPPARAVDPFRKPEEDEGVNRG